MVMKEVTLMAILGIAAGLPIALGLSRLIRGQLFGLAPHDPLTLVLSVMALAAISLLAGYLPAERATRVDPVTALRYE